MTPRIWLPILITLFLLGILLQIPLLAGFMAMLMVIIAMADWWRNHSLDGVTYKRRPHYRRAFPGERVPMRIQVENRKLLPLSWLRVQDPWPKAIGPEDENLMAPTHSLDRGLLVNVFSLRWYESVNRSYSLLFRERGSYAVGPSKLESGDFFGLYDQVKEENAIDVFTVFPSLLSFQELQLPADDPFGDRRSRRRLYEDPTQPMGVREYMPEDSFRRVHWPASAHTGQLQVKVYQQTSSNVLVVCLNVATFARHWEGTNPALLEYLIRVTATLVHKGIQDGYRVGLLANGCLAHADQPFRIPPGRSPKQLATLLEALAGVTPVVTGRFDRFLMKELPRVPYGATLLLVTGVITPELAETLARLKRRGRQLNLISFDTQPPPYIPGIRSFHLPFKE